jgi:hypothetical protein
MSMACSVVLVLVLVLVLRPAGGNGDLPVQSRHHYVAARQRSAPDARSHPVWQGIVAETIALRHWLWRQGHAVVTGWWALLDPDWTRPRHTAGAEAHTISLWGRFRNLDAIRWAGFRWQPPGLSSGFHDVALSSDRRLEPLPQGGSTGRDVPATDLCRFGNRRERIPHPFERNSCDSAECIL